jgi:shikimate dehydrogenase
MRHFGLIGKKLGHSFSKDYFEKKWQSGNIIDCIYKNYELESLDELQEILQIDMNLVGLNVTNPYKIQIIPYLDELTSIAMETQSVNCIKKVNEKWIGHNTDAPAFLNSLGNFLPTGFAAEVLILGSGGASHSIQWATKQQGLKYDIASTSGKGITYPELHFNWNPDWKLIINTTPLGTWPETNDLPDIPYQYIDDSYYLYDLIYNPEKTLFLKRGAEQGSAIKNGLEMLHLQADKSWLFWNE